MPLSKVVFAARAAIIQLPGYLFYWLCWWIYPQMTLREKAALCPHPEVRKLLLIRSGIRVGRQVEINFGILCHGRGRNPPPVDLGDRVALGPHVTLVTSSYPGCSKLLQLADVEPLVAWLRPIRVEEDAWLGAGVIVLPGVTIGRGAVVGAGAVVTRDVAPYTVVAGVPARLIRTLSAPPGACDEA